MVIITGHFQSEMYFAAFTHAVGAELTLVVVVVLKFCETLQPPVRDGEKDGKHEGCCATFIHAFTTSCMRCFHSTSNKINDS